MHHPRMLRQRFDRAIEADAFVKRLQAVGLPGSGWELDDEWRPVDAVTARRQLVPDTMWTAVCAYRSATWRQSSGNGRKSAAPALRALAHQHKACFGKMLQYFMRRLDKEKVALLLAQPGNRADEFQCAADVATAKFLCFLAIRLAVGLQIDAVPDDANF